MSNRSLFLKSGFVRAPLGLGVGRYVCQLQRVTLKFCLNHGDSRGARDFVEHDLVNYAKENPGTVVYIKPRRHRVPVISAEYLNGEKHWIPISNESREDIVKWMELLRTQFQDGSRLRLRKFWHTDFPSIQGPWTPFTFRNPALNLAEFPNKELGERIKTEKSASEQLIDMWKQQHEPKSLDDIPVQKNVVIE